MAKLFILLSLFSFPALGQKTGWIHTPQSQWPQVALINEVWYQNGERYIHPSFEYAATAFLIESEGKVYGVTAKHVLWIAKASSMQAVDLQGKLVRWIMRPKGNMKDSVVIDQLINKDDQEWLSGPKSSITERDWLVFSIKSAAPNIQTLVPRYSAVKAGEQVWYFGCPYKEKTCQPRRAKVLDVSGNKIIFSKPEGAEVAGASGSPIVDANGQLIGILGGSSVDKKTGKPALYGTTTHYLYKVLHNQKPYNTPLIPITQVIEEKIEKEDFKSGIKAYKQMQKQPKNHFIYNFKPELLNDLGKQFLDKNQHAQALTLFKLSLKEMS